MEFNKLNIESKVLDFFRQKHSKSSLNTINSLLEKLCGIRCFFENESEFSDFKQQIETEISTVYEVDRSEYGDFQTNENLASTVCKYLATKNIQPQFLIEPTCGKGNFILSAIKNFETLQYIF